MDKQNYWNTVTKQVADLQNLAPVQVAECFCQDMLKEVLPTHVAADIQRVIMTGCGDSYSAVGAMAKAFEACSSIQAVKTPDIVDFCDFYTRQNVLQGCDPGQVLVVVVSFSGGADRLVQALQKARQMGVGALLITRTPQSPAGRVAEYILNVNTPEGCNTPGLRSYYASMVGIIALAAYIGCCKGNLSQDEFKCIADQLVCYTQNFMADFDRLDTQMFEWAQRVKDLKKFEAIGDGADAFSAQFVEQKFIECAGVYCDHINSEEFAHISYFLRGPKEIGTVVIIHEKDPSFSRMRDTIGGCLKQNRPTLIITDSRNETFEEIQREDAGHNLYGMSFDMDKNAPVHPVGVPEICRVAASPYLWMAPIMDFVPGALLAGYVAALNETKFFAGKYNFRTMEWED